MKKLVMLVIAAASAVVLTGCGNSSEKLVKSYIEVLRSDDDTKMEQFCKDHGAEGKIEVDIKDDLLDQMKSPRHKIVTARKMSAYVKEASGTVTFVSATITGNTLYDGATVYFATVKSEGKNEKIAGASSDERQAKDQMKKLEEEYKKGDGEVTNFQKY